MSDFDEMVAEGQILEDEQLMDEITGLAEELVNDGFPKDNVRETILANHQPSNINYKRWTFLVDSAMENV